jgi:ketosteroid isomerase-like protein
MTSANLELVRSIYAAWERGDYSSSEWTHPEIEWEMACGPAPGSWRGLAGMAEAFRDFLSAWDDWRVEAEEYLELDSERSSCYPLQCPRQDKPTGAGADAR